MIVDPGFDEVAARLEAHAPCVLRATLVGDLETPVGAMQGSYQMLADDGAHFDAPIAPFTLAMPGLLH